MPKKNGLIILDIDNTLIDTKFVYKEFVSSFPRANYTLTKSETRDFINDKEIADNVRILIYKRPYLNQFLKYILQHYHVGIWTAAKNTWMHLILKKIMPTYKNKFIFKWHREHSTPNEKYMKPLTKVFNQYPKFNSLNTLIIDDNYTTTEIKVSHLNIDRFEIKLKKDNKLPKDDHLKLIIKILKKQKNNFNPNEVILDYIAEFN